jgi:hypothetical protein
LLGSSQGFSRGAVMLNIALKAVDVLVVALIFSALA